MVMQILKELSKALLRKNEIFSLINAANAYSPLLRQNYVTSEEGFFKFSDKSKGIPILVPADKKLFNFTAKDVFTLRKTDVLELVYDIVNEFYTGFKHAFYRFEFLSDFQVKAKYQSFLQKLLDQNRELITYVQKLKQEFKHVGAFQTRNIPHFGHEKILQCLLEPCDHVVINPVVGPKKTGDVAIERLAGIYSYLSKTKYGGKISFHPVSANMFYAGPREAVHHAWIRQRIGFHQFTVGRDHAGADNVYKPEMAANLIYQNRKSFKIKILTHTGAAFCTDCDKVILVGDCSHPVERILDISGSDFRACLKEKRLFKFADKQMQDEIFKLKEDIFEQ